MKHFMIKFNHGVEIGAFEAYRGHYARTGDDKILDIMLDEASHEDMLDQMLEKLGEKPNRIIDGSFRAVGKTIAFFCKFCPLSMLDFVARTMETFAIFNYAYLALEYPQFTEEFAYMAIIEKRHEKYFGKAS